MSTVLSANLLQSVERETSTESVASIARYLQEQLGQKLVAYLAGINDAKMVGRWAAGKHRPSELAVLRLRCAYETVRLIGAAYDGDTAKAWLFGTNSRLGDEAPAYLMRHAASWDDLREIPLAARAFAGGAG